MIQVSEVAKPPRKGRPIPAVRSPTRLCASPFYIRQFGSLRKLSDCYKSEAIPPPCDGKGNGYGAVTFPTNERGMSGERYGY